ncbi:hypothetical protein [Glycomyces sp. NPDC047010]|uniref:hypothetical protein n=1 Tax=Glycomyces sp. NPDC047010 TaxID=3155023 RepID=UPI0033DB84C3
MAELDTTRCLGEGVLTWLTEERTLGRFGSVQLALEDGEYAHFAGAPVGALARLSATVLQVRHAVLPVDQHRKLAPTQPNWGEEIDLGIGWVYQPDLAELGTIAIGLAPLAEFWRGNEWLSPTALYRAHNHHVRLDLHPYRGFTRDMTRTADAA